MTDEQLIAGFETLDLASGSFHHADHVRLAFAYLRRYDLFESMSRYRVGLKRFATHAGAPGKYHETVTCALLLLIHERMAADSSPDDWAAFALANPDLLEWKGGAFFDYYDVDVLESDLARETFVLPHRAPRKAQPGLALAGAIR
jgi:hypothetical protein